MKYSLKDFYTLDNMYYFPNIQDGIWVDEIEAQNIINEMNTEIEDENEPWKITKVMLHGVIIVLEYKIKEYEYNSY